MKFVRKDNSTLLGIASTVAYMVLVELNSNSSRTQKINCNVLAIVPFANQELLWIAIELLIATFSVKSRNSLNGELEYLATKFLNTNLIYLFIYL